MKNIKIYIPVLLALIHAACIFAVSDTVSVIGVGDLMMGTSFPDSSTLPADP
jgi:hypothetical protein